MQLQLRNDTTCISLKKLRLQYDVDTKLLRSCSGEATKRNYTYTHKHNYESFCYIAMYMYTHRLMQLMAIFWLD